MAGWSAEGRRAGVGMLEALADWLGQHGVTTVALEATSVYEQYSAAVIDFAVVVVFFAFGGRAAGVTPPSGTLRASHAPGAGAIPARPGYAAGGNR